jgi:hypothetical protein
VSGVEHEVRGWRSHSLRQAGEIRRLEAQVAGAVEECDELRELLRDALAYVDGRPGSPAYQMRQRLRRALGGQ